MDYKAQWFESQRINEEHTSVEIRQVYTWIYTSDKKLVIVSKDGQKWQLPGGHPKTGESVIQTAVREIAEETGLNVEDKQDTIQTFGYYVLKGYEKEELKESFIQLRTLLKLNQKESELKLGVSKEEENELEEDKVKYVKAVTLEEVFELIPWLKTKDEYISLTSMDLLA